MSPWDLDGDKSYIKIDWGDGTVTDWLGPYPDDEYLEFTHTWKRGKFKIKVYVKDTKGAESWIYSYIIVRMGVLSRSTPFSLNKILESFLENYPNAFPILRKILQPRDKTQQDSFLFSIKS